MSLICVLYFFVRVKVFCKKNRLEITLIPSIYTTTPTAISGGVDISEVAGVICYNTGVLREGHKNYFKDWYLINWQPTFLFLTYLNLMNYGHIIKSM